MGVLVAVKMIVIMMTHWKQDTRTSYIVEISTRFTTLAKYLQHIYEPQQ